MTHGVYIAVGYSASNVVLIQGDGGNIIMDTGANPVDARDIKAALGAVGRAPVRAIIYTHSHPDHTGGAKIFAGTDAPPIIARFEIPEAAIGRANRDGGDQFGMTLPESEYINAGVQMEFGRRTPPTREGYLPPTRIFSSDREALTIAGVRLELISTPGETDDTLSVWLPEKRVLVSGDNVLRTFPNIAPIRGAKMRSPEEWIASLNKLLALKADYLLPGHTRPVIGADNVRLVMTALSRCHPVDPRSDDGRHEAGRASRRARAACELPPIWPQTPICRSFTVRSNGWCVACTPTAWAGSTATRPTSFR